MTLGQTLSTMSFDKTQSSLGISTKSVPVGAHWSNDIIVGCYSMLWRAYHIIIEEIGKESKGVAFQILVKTMNDTAGPDGLVPTILVFGAYLRRIEHDPSLSSISQCSAAIKKANERNLCS